MVWRVLRKGSTAGLVSSVLAGSSGLVGQFGALVLSAENGYNSNFGTLFSTLKTIVARVYVCVYIFFLFDALCSL